MFKEGDWVISTFDGKIIIVQSIEYMSKYNIYWLKGKSCKNNKVVGDYEAMKLEYFKTTTPTKQELKVLSMVEPELYEQVVQILKNLDMEGV